MRCLPYARKTTLDKSYKVLDLPLNCAKIITYD
jgi:hypothetical protein